MALKNLILDKVVVSGNKVEYPFRAADALKKYFTKDKVTIEYDTDMSGVPESILSIPFIGCMAGLMWQADIEFWVNDLDKTFYEAFFRIKRAYQEMHSDLPLKGELVPCRFMENTTPKTGKSLLLFGGGIDCQSSFIRHEDSISDVLNIYGWLGDIAEDNKVDRHDDEFTKKFCAVAGKTPRHIRSDFFKVLNLAQIDKDFQKALHTNYWYGLLHSMAFISMGIPMAFEKGLDRIIIASSFRKGIQGYCTSFKDHECCVCDKCFRSVVQIVAEGGDPRDFGFEIKGSLKDFYSKAAPGMRIFGNFRRKETATGRRQWPG